MNMQPTPYWQLALDAGNGALACLAHPGDPHNVCRQNKELAPDKE